MANELATGKTMTTKEVAVALGTKPNVITERGKKLFPNKKIENGKSTLWTETEVTAILQAMKETPSPNRTYQLTNRLANTTTDIEEDEIVAKAISIMQRRIQRLQSENTELTERNSRLEFALEYDKAKDCVSWGEWKKANHIKASFAQIAKELNLEEGVDFFRQVLADGSRFPTIRVKESCLQSIFENYSEK